MICYDVSLAPRTTSLALFAASSIVVKFLAVYAFPLGGIYYTAMLLGSLRQKCEMSSLMGFKKKTVMKKTAFTQVCQVGGIQNHTPREVLLAVSPSFISFSDFLAFLAFSERG